MKWVVCAAWFTAAESVNGTRGPDKSNCTGRLCYREKWITMYGAAALLTAEVEEFTFCKCFSGNGHFIFFFQANRLYIYSYIRAIGIRVHDGFFVLFVWHNFVISAVVAFVCADIISVPVICTYSSSLDMNFMYSERASDCIEHFEASVTFFPCLRFKFSHFANFSNVARLHSMPN